MRVDPVESELDQETLSTNLQEFDEAATRLQNEALEAVLLNPPGDGRAREEEATFSTIMPLVHGTLVNPEFDPNSFSRSREETLGSTRIPTIHGEEHIPYTEDHFQESMRLFHATIDSNLQEPTEHEVTPSKREAVMMSNPRQTTGESSCGLVGRRGVGSSSSSVQARTLETARSEAFFGSQPLQAQLLVVALRSKSKSSTLMTKCSSPRLTCMSLLVVLLLAVAGTVTVVIQRKGSSMLNPTLSPVDLSLPPSSSPNGVPTKSPVAATPAPSISIPEPTHAPTHIARKCFSDILELRQAVDDYLVDSDPDTETARTYGWPIGSWCTDHVTRLDGLFNALRNERASAFNEDISGWNTSSVLDMSYLFQGATSFDQDLSGWDTSSLTRMVFSFNGASKFNSEIGSWDVSRVRQFESAFRQAITFNQDLPWDVSTAEKMENMFKGCEAFNGNISGWNTQRVKEVVSMFEGASSFDQDLSRWNLTSVTSLNRMFAGATAFNGNVATWDVSHVTSFRETFRGCAAFNQDLSSWDVSSADDFTRMFAWATSYTQDLCRWYPIISEDAWMPMMFYETSCDSPDDPNLLSTRPGPFCSVCEYKSAAPSSSFAPSTTFRPSPPPSTSVPPSSSFTPSQAPSGMLLPSDNVLPCFGSASELYTAVDSYLIDRTPDSITAQQYGWPIGTWCVSEVTSFYQLFSTARNSLVGTFNEDITQWDTSRVTNMESMFEGNEAFNQDLSRWNTSRVTTFRSMFRGARSFNQDLLQWDTSRARSFHTMFEDAWVFNGQLDGWNTALVQDMYGLFRSAFAFNQDIASWDVSRVKDMERCFFRASSFDQNLSRWDVRNVERMNSMFERASSFNGNIQNWSVSRLIDATEMFQGASSFNQNLSSWRFPPSLISVQRMFDGATSFNGDIGDWDVSSVANFDGFLRGATSFNQDLTLWNIRTALFLREMFAGAASFRQDLCHWRFRLAAYTRVDDMFRGTNCPATDDPALSARPVNPVCFQCI